MKTRTKLIVEIPDKLHKSLKLAAVKEDTTIKKLVTEILQKEFGR